MSRLAFARHELAAVAAGGALGATVRYEAIDTWPVASGSFPTTVLVVNLCASLLLGLFLARLDDRHGDWRGRPVLRAGLVAGVVGGLGTLSLVSVELARLIADGYGTTPHADAPATVIGGIVALSIGLLGGGWRPAWHAVPEEDEL